MAALCDPALAFIDHEALNDVANDAEFTELTRLTSYLTTWSSLKHGQDDSLDGVDVSEAILKVSVLVARNEAFRFQYENDPVDTAQTQAVIVSVKVKEEHVWSYTCTSSCGLQPGI